MTWSDLESPRKRMFHRITGWLVVIGGSLASYAIVVFLNSR